ncbi:MAG: hypothetical protein COA90_01255 [Gammaproteobacteria bacterium]|nr:MAG: hypothetical protein COA90_01255 [Gammaproteobacteria bacterium]
MAGFQHLFFWQVTALIVISVILLFQILQPELHHSITESIFYSEIVKIVLFIIVMSGLSSSLPLLRDKFKQKADKLFPQNPSQDEVIYKALFESSVDPILLIEDSKFIDCNLAAVKMLGCKSKDYLLNLHPSQISPEFQSDGRNSLDKEREVDEIVHRQGNHRFVWEHLKQNGDVFPVEVLLTVVTIGQRKLLHVVWQDITARRKQEEKLEHIANYDVLTHLPNRSLFADRFKQAIARADRSQLLVAICFLDLDNFKRVNDNYGHDVGDQLLIEVSNRITSAIRSEDTVSRQGGDEFTILLNNISSIDTGKKVLDKIHKALAKPYIINGYSHSISASSGITFYPLDEGDLDLLLRHADQAMYEAKKTGKNQYHLFNVEDAVSDINKQTQIKDIEMGLLNEEFCLYYQPKVNMKTGKVFGLEALIRWIHPKKGLIAPLSFLPYVSGTKLEIKIGQWVINQALIDLDKWLKEGRVFEVSINISSHHLQSDHFVAKLESALAQYPAVAAKQLQLEILESHAIDDVKLIRDIIKRCQNTLGVNVALDDFGTGYSSLTHLRNLPANIIKIDQSFVRNVLIEPNDYSIIDGIISLAHAFNRGYIAEGVETTEHGIILLLMGCIQAQGYAISVPLPVDELSKWLDNYKPNPHWTRLNNKGYSLQQSKVKLLQLTTEYWFNNMVKRVFATEGFGFDEELIKCQLSEWIKLFSREGMFEEQWLIELQSADAVMFQLARDLADKLQLDDDNIIQASFDEFERSYQEVNTIFESYKVG